MKQPVHVQGCGLLSAVGRDRIDVVSKLHAGEAQPAVLALPDLGLGGRFLFRPLPTRLVPDGEERLDAMVYAAVDDALREARLSVRERRQLPVFVGSSSMDLGNIETQAQRRAEATTSLRLRKYGWSVIADRVARHFDLNGPRYSFSVACSSATNALLTAMAEVAAGRLEQALVVGVECHNTLGLHGFNSLGMLADDACRPFDRQRRGLVLGEAAAAVVIGRGDGRCRLLGGANRCDAGNITRPTPDGMVATMKDALAAARIAAGEITAVKAHGTGTEVNDTAEAEALHQLFGETLPPVSSLKPQLGYTLGANGLVELVAWLWCLEDGFIPATPNFRQPDPDVGIMPLQAPLPCASGHFLLNCFGFGGNNSCLVIGYD